LFTASGNITDYKKQTWKFYPQDRTAKDLAARRIFRPYCQRALVYMQRGTLFAAPWISRTGVDRPALLLDDVATIPNELMRNSTLQGRPPGRNLRLWSGKAATGLVDAVPTTRARRSR